MDNQHVYASFFRETDGRVRNRKMNFITVKKRTFLKKVHP